MAAEDIHCNHKFELQTYWNIVTCLHEGSWFGHFVLNFYKSTAWVSESQNLMMVYQKRAPNEKCKWSRKYTLMLVVLRADFHHLFLS